MRVLVLLLALAAGSACGSLFRDFDEVNNPDDDSALARCRKLGRAEREAGASPQAAFDAYEDCTREAGLR